MAANQAYFGTAERAWAQQHNKKAISVFSPSAAWDVHQGIQGLFSRDVGEIWVPVCRPGGNNNNKKTYRATEHFIKVDVAAALMNQNGSLSVWECERGKCWHVERRSRLSCRHQTDSCGSCLISRRCKKQADHMIHLGVACFLWTWPRESPPNRRPSPGHLQMLLLSFLCRMEINNDSVNDIFLLPTIVVRTMAPF